MKSMMIKQKIKEIELVAESKREREDKDRGNE